MASTDPDGRFIRWLGRDAGDPAEVGNKSATLHAAWAAGVPVVDGFCVTTDAVRTCLARGGSAGRVARLATDVDVNGYELTRISRAFREILVEVPFAPEVGDAVRAAYAALPGAPPGLVVRSSATTEDLAGASAAGIHLSRTATTPEELFAAIREVWASLYGLPALYYRRRHRLRSATAAMAVLVQHRLTPAALGVYFTTDPTGGAGGLVEWNDPRSAASAAGAATDGGPVRRIRLPRRDDELEPQWLSELTRLGDRVVRLLAAPADVEWAVADGRVVLLQARPVGGRPAPSGAAPVGGRRPPADPAPYTLAAADDDDACRHLALGDLADLHRKWRAKHRHLRRRAQAAGIEVAGCYYVAYHAATAPAAAQALAPLLRTPYLSLDVSPELRTIVVPREELSPHLALLAAHDGSLTVRVRDYYTDHHSLLSGAQAYGTVLVEHTPGGIKGLIRGLSAVNRYRVGADGRIETLREAPGTDHYVFRRQVLTFERATQSGAEPQPDDPHIDRNALRTVAEFTRQASANGNRMLLEWCVTGGRPYLLDHSVERSTAPLPGHAGLDVMSAGAASGRALVLASTAALEYLSDGNLLSVDAVDPTVAQDDAVRELLATVSDRSRHDPVILVAQRPIAALAVTVDDVDGFIFEDGALLSHLAILIREASKPAVLLPGATAAISDGGWTTIGADGTVTTEPDGTAGSDK